MKIVLDDITAKKKLYPFTAIRSVADIRVGILTIREKWEKLLDRKIDTISETITWEDGQEYPVIKLEISNTSHPFYTGKNVLVDTAGRIDKFKKRYEKRDK